MRIKQLLEMKEERKIPLVDEHDTIREVLEKMLKHPHTRLMYVVDKNGRCSGVISLGVLIRHLCSSSFEPAVHARFLIPMITSETAKDIMNNGVIYANAEDDIKEVTEKMIKSSIKEIPILNENKKIIGDITMLDLLKHFHLGQE